MEAQGRKFTVVVGDEFDIELDDDHNAAVEKEHISDDDETANATVSASAPIATDKNQHIWACIQAVARAN